MQQLFDYSPEVIHALEQKKPVLALESTLITHGLPSPFNLEIAKEVEEIARRHDVTPATIAIMHGKIKIGLTNDELVELVTTEDAIKTSKRDIPNVISSGKCGGTTVAGTMFCAHKAGIKVFATGGIGGVHHGDGQDISADLIELAQTPMAVVCAGAKSILDLPRTMEFLETYSVPVIGYGTDSLPAFYTASTSHALNIRVESIESLAQLLNVHWQLGMNTGSLVTVPIDRNDEIPSTIIEPAIASALKLANERNIRGKEITPFLLSELVKATEGKSLNANMSLIRNNVELGTKLAAALG